MQKIKEFIPIYRDLMFKNLFGTDKNKKFTIDMLEKLFCLDKGSLDDSVIKNSIKLDKEKVLSKKFELDVILETPEKDILNLEMQCLYNNDAEKKNFMYITGLFYSQLNKSDNYKDTKSVTGINFVKDLTIHKNNEAIQKYVMTNVKDPEDKMLPELFNVMVISVDHNCEIFYNETNNEFENWRLFIGCDTKEELEEISKRSPILEEAYKECIRFMDSDYVQNYEAKEKLIRSQMISMKEDGFAEGKLEGKLEAREEFAQNLLRNTDLTLEEISKNTGLTLDEVEKLKEK